MSRCVYCRRRLSGFETLCQECLEAGYDRLVHPKPWWHRLRPHLTRGNLFGFSLLFVFSFLLFRFDFPYFHIRHMKTTQTSAVIATAIACAAFFHHDRGQSKSTAALARSLENRPTWGVVALFVVVELLAGLLLYAVFTFVSMTVGVIIALVGWAAIRVDIFDPLRTNSLWSRLSAITAVPATAFFIAWRVTDQGVWLMLMLVGSTLMGGLVLLDRWEDAK